MGFLGRLFGNKASAQPAGPAGVTRAGAEVIRVEDTHVISGVGVTVTGPLTLPVHVGENLDVSQDGKQRSLRVTGILVDQQQVDSAVPGTKVAMMLSSPQLGTI
ncbi:hypothetical protein [Prauserella cavernicola]|uniref:Uncharacterized protein n=1 Tax=Prauserella cavernicola TaxID=2800127 RepID=A0A934QSE2_9PSEU|nr:hypothetical protein [Prauserella cavernicola]MBK1784834.1 hypothetical protein [Prauserella cavernicola]